MKKIFGIVCCSVITLFNLPAQSIENNINWLTLPQLKNSGYSGGDIDTNPSAIGELIEFKDKFEFYRCPTCKSFKVKGIKKIRIETSSSSYLKDKKESYDSNKAIDGDIKTAWCEGVDGFGFKESLNINFNFEIDNKVNTYKDGIGFNYLLIYPGFGRSKELFYKNNRIKSLVLLVTVYKKNIDQKTGQLKLFKFTQGYRLKFEDINKYHLFLIEDPILIGKRFEFNFYIEDIYKGSKYNDTCISEIMLLF